MPRRQQTIPLNNTDQNDLNAIVDIVQTTSWNKFLDSNFTEVRFSRFLYNKSALVQVMVLYLTGDKALPEPGMNWLIYVWLCLNTLGLRRNRRHFADIFKCIFLNENVWILIKISLEFAPRVRIDSIPAMVQIMALCRPGDKSLSEPMVVRLSPHICVTRPRWANHYFIIIISCLARHCESLW